MILALKQKGGKEKRNQNLTQVSETMFRKQTNVPICHLINNSFPDTNSATINKS
jgi:hypothetical protein